MKEIYKKDNVAKKKPKVLVAPLDWGLGHTTRCIPLINELLNIGCEVVIASEKGQKTLLEAEFPALKSIELRGYRLEYGKNRWQTFFKIFLQIPKILTAIKRENAWLAHVLEAEGLDAVVSDNRYGLHSPKLFSVFMTHQLCIQTPFGRRAEQQLQSINYRFINKFDACWVPDVDNKHTLAGRLAHPEKFPEIPVHYIGWLSRFTKSTPSSFSKDLLVLISGPEPQRSIFENIMLEELKHFEGRAVLVRGLPGEKTILTIQNVEVYNHLSTADFHKMINESALVISRSGYSTVMDLVRLGKKSVLVATPGQTEQEYLADYLFQKNMALNAVQDHFSLKDVLTSAGQFAFVHHEGDDRSLLQSAVAELVQKIKR